MTTNIPSAVAGQHAWYGNYDPAHYTPLYGNYYTFSVSCFEYLPKSSGGLKRGPAKVRVSGRRDKPEKVYEKATEICRLLDAGTYDGPKNIVVKESDPC